MWKPNSCISSVVPGIQQLDGFLGYVPKSSAKSPGARYNPGLWFRWNLWSQPRCAPILFPRAPAGHWGIDCPMFKVSCHFRDFLIASPGVSKTLVQEKMPFSFADSLSGLCWADEVPFAAAPQTSWWLADSRQEWLPWCFISSQKIYSRERGHAGSSMVCLSSDPSGKRLHCFYSQHLTLLLRLVNKEAN